MYVIRFLRVRMIKDNIFNLLNDRAAQRDVRFKRLRNPIYVQGSRFLNPF